MLILTFVYCNFVFLGEMSMKKFSLFALVTATIISTQTFAQETKPTTTPQPTPQAISVMEAMTMPDDSTVILEGTITSKLGDETYIFTDSSGNINVEIDDEEWNGVSPQTDEIIMIQGEVDKDGNLVEIDVEAVMLPTAPQQ